MIGDDIVIQFGLPPNRIDLLTCIKTVEFADAWENRLEEKITIDDYDYPIYFISLEQLIENKESVKRSKDLEDLKFLNKLKKK